MEQKNIDTGTSLETLRFFEKKFTDLFRLIPQIEAVSSLENYIKELHKAVSYLEDKVAQTSLAKSDLEDQNAQLFAEIEQATLTVQRAKKEERASKQAGIDAAAAAYDEAIQKATSEGLKRMSEIDIAISSKAAKAAELEQNIHKKEKELSNIESAIKQALSKLGA